MDQMNNNNNHLPPPNHQGQGQGGSGGNSPNPMPNGANRGGGSAGPGMNNYPHDNQGGPGPSSFHPSQMAHAQMNPMAFMSQFQGMMGAGGQGGVGGGASSNGHGGMPNNPQDMMAMMGNFCQTANGGGGGGGVPPGVGGGAGNMGYMGMPGGGNDHGVGALGQGGHGGMNQMAAQMMRKRPMEGFGDDEDGNQGPAPKRGNFGDGSSSGMPNAMQPGLDLGVHTNNGGGVSNPSSAPVDEKPPATTNNNNPTEDSGGGAGAANLTPSSPRGKDHVSIPPSKEGIKFYSRNDVLCGRGGGTNVHPGNRRFRDLINANRRAYLKARKNDKPAISRSIVRTIREMNGRFLKKDEKLGLWFEIGDDGAREKTSQALRQRAPEMRKILFEDEQRQQHQQQAEMMQRHQLMGMGQGQGLPPGMGQGMMGGGMPGMGGMGGPNFPQGAMGGGQHSPHQQQQNGQGQVGAGMGVGGNNAESLLAKYNMLHQKNWLAQEKNMILQRLAMSGLNPGQLNDARENIGSMTTQALLQQGIKPVTPRGA